jgi:hypothetical protein
MKKNSRVLVVGLVPELVDFTPFPGMNAEKVRAGIASQVAKLVELGYAAEHVYVDLGETAESVLKATLAEKSFDCLVIGAGIRNSPSLFLLFEKLLNVVHEHAAGAKICFNTNPNDTVDAVQRWT